jgi:hypothetical protein
MASRIVHSRRLTERAFSRASSRQTSASAGTSTARVNSGGTLAANGIADLDETLALALNPEQYGQEDARLDAQSGRLRHDG